MMHSQGISLGHPLRYRYRGSSLIDIYEIGEPLINAEGG